MIDEFRPMFLNAADHNKVTGTWEVQIQTQCAFQPGVVNLSDTLTPLARYKSSCYVIPIAHCRSGQDEIRCIQSSNRSNSVYIVEWFGGDNGR